MKIKNLFLAATAIVVGLSSCSKDDGGKNETGEQNIFVKFEQPAATRADVAPTVDQSTSTISYGHLYFADNTGKVYRYIRVDNSNIMGTISPAVLQAGTIVQSLTTDVTEVFFYANMFGENDKWVNNVNDLKNETVTLAEQYADDYSIANAAMKGSGVLIPSTRPGVTQEAVFEVAPMIARIEIVLLKSDATDGPSAADLRGIYVNNYYKDFKVDHTLASPVVNHLQDWTKYQREPAPGLYLNSDEGHLFDDEDNAQLGSISSLGDEIKAENGVWGYNVFAHGEPHIVFHFENVADKNGTAYDNKEPGALFGTDTAYLTLTRFVDLVTGGAVNVQAGNVYKINVLDFTVGDMGDTPEPIKKKDVWVEIKPMKWTVIPVGGAFD